MTTKKRAKILRFMSQAINDLDRCLIELRKLIEVYVVDYSDRAFELHLIANQVIEIQKLLERFKQERM